VLHTVNKSPYSNSALENCLGRAGAGNVILLLEDGVYAAAAGTTKSHLIEAALREHEVYAIGADLAARGLDRLIEGVRVADYDVFVDLVEQHTVHAWL